MAGRFWPGQNPIGKRFRAGGRWCEIIGVARNSKYRSLAESPEPHVYQPLFQEFHAEVLLHVRARVNPATLRSALEGVVARLNPNLPLVDVRPLSAQIELALSGYRMAAALLAVFGLVALAMASIGTYGVMAHSVTQRTREIGIRTALGADRSQIFKLVVGQGMGLILSGVVIGLVAAAALTRFLSSLLFEISPRDPLTFLAVPAAVSVIALAAAALPARAAARVDPLTALRYE
jgi:ABC-type antimicrobial peptide transport system permease subunit